MAYPIVRGRPSSLDSCTPSRRHSTCSCSGRSEERGTLHPDDSPERDQTELCSESISQRTLPLLSV